MPDIQANVDPMLQFICALEVQPDQLPSWRRRVCASPPKGRRQKQHNSDTNEITNW
jgi:hypothetical protein